MMRAKTTNRSILSLVFGLCVCMARIADLAIFPLTAWVLGMAGLCGVGSGRSGSTRPPGLGPCRGRGLNAAVVVARQARKGRARAVAVRAVDQRR